ncbi:MAG TPA: hypothetical protein VN860_01475, partial [Candidatus Acidoferrales bacterium]|nr:hypothetical protein [Candidatus Acidoferrales bacterium]
DPATPYGAAVPFNSKLNLKLPEHGLTQNLENLSKINWLAFLNTYRTKCLTPHPDFRLMLDDIGRFELAQGYTLSVDLGRSAKA